MNMKGGRIEMSSGDKERCVICDELIEGRGNNPSPISSEGLCCDDCNFEVVIPARIDDIDIEKIEEESEKEI